MRSRFVGVNINEMCKMKIFTVVSKDASRLKTIVLLSLCVYLAAADIAENVRSRRLTLLSNGYRLLRSRLRSVQRTRSDNFTTTVR